MTQLRILVTGSRSWRDYDTIRADLLDVLAETSTAGAPVLIQGGQVSRDPDGSRFGADFLARQAGQSIADESGIGMLHEEVPADWSGPCDPQVCVPGHRRPSRRGGSGSYCPAAGVRRNQAMIDDHRPTVALAYPLGRSSGTYDCIRRIRAAGIVVEGEFSRAFLPWRTLDRATVLVEEAQQ